MYDDLVKQLRDNAEFLVKASSGCLSNSFADTMYQAADAIEKLLKRVPKTPHGRLIDSDELTKEMRLFIKENMLSRDDARELLETIAEAHTIIQAEELYGQYTDTAGNLHWCGTHSGEHKSKAEED